MHAPDGIYTAPHSHPLKSQFILLDKTLPGDRHTHTYTESLYQPSTPRSLKSPLMLHDKLSQFHTTLSLRNALGPLNFGVE